ncbi:MAG TPA: hypothetical protein VNZ58_14035 [Thermomicrobiales bacterium]|nr:hypothetical protein [Thermomicrobiales bacterium]
MNSSLERSDSPAQPRIMLAIASGASRATHNLNLNHNHYHNHPAALPPLQERTQGSA